MTTPISLKVEVPPASIKKIAEAGRLTEFLAAFPAAAAREIATHMVDVIAGKQNGLSINVGFHDDDEFGNGFPPHKIGPRIDVAIAKHFDKTISIRG